MTTSSASACELRSGHFSIFTIRVHSLDLDAVTATLADHVAAAPDLLGGAPAVLELPDEAMVPAEELLRDLLDRVRYAGLSPLGYVASDDSPLGVAVQRLKLPLLAPELKRRRGDQADAATPADLPTTPERTVAASDPAPASEPQYDVLAPPLIHTDMVRTGQRIYARGRDLVLLGPVSYGAEVIADGNVYSFHRLQGKVLAGARGDTEARIVCARFDPELVSVAGTYRVLETVPAELKDRVVQVRLVGERLEMLPLSTGFPV
jgi:septum site-determining protein MinC